MSRPQGPNYSLFQFESTFRMMFPKGSYMSPQLVTVLNSFEERLAYSLKKLMATANDNILSLSWMKLAMESLCDTHKDVKDLISDLELPVSEWSEEWTNVYLNNSMKLLDLCNAFSSEMSRLSQGHLMLQFALQNVDSSTTKLAAVHNSLERWKMLVVSKNPRLENSSAILEHIFASLNLPKVKNSAKGKILMRAMYGVKVKTLFISGIFTAALSSSPKMLVQLHVPEALPWADAFTTLQMVLNGEIRTQFSCGSAILLKELKAVNARAASLFYATKDVSIPMKSEILSSTTTDLRNEAEKLSNGLDTLTKAVDNFFYIVLAGRDTLLCSLRSNNTVSDFPRKKHDSQTVR